VRLVPESYLDKLQSRDYDPPTYKKPQIPGFDLGLNTEKNELVIESDTPNPCQRTDEDGV